ncbi:acyltransferase [Vibrio neptunius]|nr:acyltransferase [Vibrio neptunius]
MNKRIESLDYLRGLMALSIMIYHYYIWHIGELSSYSLLGKLGIYAVSVFYVLSGLSLAIVYRNKVVDLASTKEFLLKRIFRIAPLLWFVTSIYIVLKLSYIFFFHDGEMYSLSDIVLNYTLMFGFFKPDGYIAIGGWSLGNEIVFYSLLPFVFLLMLKRNFYFFVVFLLSWLYVIYFSFFYIDESVPLARQWGDYINPLNQIYMFLSGVALGLYRNYIDDLGKRSFFLLFLAVLLSIWLYPVESGEVHLVSGWNRILLSLLCICLVLICLKSTWVLRGKIRNILLFLGDRCYSIYLIHPIVSLVAVQCFSIIGFPQELIFIVSVLLTLLLSSWTYKFIELKSISLGNMYISKKTLSTDSSSA